MDDEEYDVTEATGQTRIKGRRATALDFVTMFLILLQEIAEAFSVVLDHTVGIVAAHDNYKRDQRNFADDVRAGLDSIPTTHEE